MAAEFIKKTKFSTSLKSDSYDLPPILQNTLNHCLNFFKSSPSNKLCLVCPSKEYSAQWLAITLALNLVQKDYHKYAHEIFNAHRKYKEGDKLILNNNAIVEWVGKVDGGIKFKTKKQGRSSQPEVTVRFENIIKLQPAPPKRTALSTYRRVQEGLSKVQITPIDKLLQINTEGNRLFLKNSLCLVSNLNLFHEVDDELLINNHSVSDYFPVNKIDNEGQPALNHSPLLLSNDLINLTLYLQSHHNTVKTILIDGFYHIHIRRTDFSDIDSRNISTILFTDLTEIEHFDEIKNLGFNFLSIDEGSLVQVGNDISRNDYSPFKSFNSKLRNYLSFQSKKEICQNDLIEFTSELIHAIEANSTENEVIKIKVSLVKLFNLVSRIAYVPNTKFSGLLNENISAIEASFRKNMLWLGDSKTIIETAIAQLKTLINNFIISPSEKCIKLTQLLKENKYDYIICVTEIEVNETTEYIKNNFSDNAIHIPKIILISDFNNDDLSGSMTKAILTGWPKSNRLNRLMTGFHISELTVLYYKFEYRYHKSLQKRNLGQVHVLYEKQKGSETSYSNTFKKLFEVSEHHDGLKLTDFNIVDFELEIDKSFYSGYIADSGNVDSLKAKRIDFGNDYFMYSSESHNLLIINSFFENSDNPNIRKGKVNQISVGDVIVFISTERDILVETVEKQIKSHELEEIKYWTELWKVLLRRHFVQLRRDFKKLMTLLRQNGCEKTEAAVRTWLFDENMIGPNDNIDLEAIGHITKNRTLLENVPKVREAILHMRRWRMQASDHIIRQMKSSLSELLDESIINTEQNIDELGKITVLKVRNINESWEEIDIRYVNRLILNEI